MNKEKCTLLPLQGENTEYKLGFNNGLKLASEFVRKDKTPVVKTPYHVQYNSAVDKLADDILKLEEENE